MWISLYGVNYQFSLSMLAETPCIGVILSQETYGNFVTTHVAVHGASAIHNIDDAHVKKSCNC